jgi:hypothetical protein
MSQSGNTLGNRPLIPQLPKRSHRCEHDHCIVGQFENKSKIKRRQQPINTDETC